MTSNIGASTAAEGSSQTTVSAEGSSRRRVRGTLTAAEALHAAASEGLTLVRRPDGCFWGVKPTKSSSYQATLSHSGRSVYLGSFRCAEEGALYLARNYPSFAEAAYLRLQGRQQLELSQPQFTRAEVQALAAAEGLALIKAPAGGHGEYQGVYYDPKIPPTLDSNERTRRKPYVARLRAFRGSPSDASLLSRKHKNAKGAAAPLRNIGVFASADEAALAIARDLGPAAGRTWVLRGATARDAEAPSRRHLQPSAKV